MAQLNYSYDTEPGLPGMIADSSFHDIVGELAASADIGFGLGLKRNTTNGKQCDIVNNVADSFFGIAVFTNVVGGKYFATDAVNIMRKGRIWVPVTVSVTYDEPAYVDVATGRLTNVSTGNVATGGSFKYPWTFDLGKVNNISILEINLP